MKTVALLLCICIGAALAAAPSAVKTTKKKAAKSAARKPSRPPRQGAPTPDRYREIQQALIDKGFLDSPATGEWDAKSIDALKRFERSQHLKDDGKLDSMALIALGLGPKREASAQTPKPADP